MIDQEKLIEAMAESMHEAFNSTRGSPHPWTSLHPDRRMQWKSDARGALNALKATIPGHADMVAGRAVILPAECTDEIAEAVAPLARCCGGIADDIYRAALAASPYAKGEK